MDDHGEWARVRPTPKACRSRQRAPGRMGTVGVRGGEVHCPAGLANWGALKAIFKNISNNDCVPTDATQVSGVSSGCVVPAPHLTPAAHGSCLVSLISASGLHSPQSLPPPTPASPGLPLPTGPHLSFQPCLLLPAAHLQVAGAWNGLLPLPGTPFPLPSGQWLHRKVTPGAPALCSQSCCHARHTLGCCRCQQSCRSPGRGGSWWAFPPCYLCANVPSRQSACILSS